MRPRRPSLFPLLLGARRAWQHPFQLLLIAVPLAAAAAIIGASSIAAAVSNEESVRSRIASEPASARAIVAKYSLDPDGLPTARAGSAAQALGLFRALTSRPVKVRIWDPIAPADQRGVRLLVTDAVASAVDIASGRLPRECHGQICEGFALSNRLGLGQSRVLGPSGGKRVKLRIVGVGALREEVLPDPDALVGNEVLVSALSGPLAQLERDSSSTVVQSALLSASAVHASELSSLAERLRVASVRVGRTDALIAFTTPRELLLELAHVGSVARSRLLIVASMGAALMLAFAAFVAASRRRELDQVRLQLETMGATRRQIMSARLGEVVLPTLLALVLVLAGLWLAVASIAARGDLLWEHAPQALPASTLLAILALGIVGVLILYFAAVPVVRPRFGLGLLELAAVTAFAVIVWQSAATGGLDPDEIASGAGKQPVLLLVPALAVFVAGVVLLRALPSIFRLAERVARRGPIPIRLALLSAARNPGQAAATTTFLAVALGSALFSFNYRASLERQADEAAAFTAGAAARATAPGSAGIADASALLRRHPAGAPALRLGGTVVEESDADQLPITVLAVPAGRLQQVVGWQDGFSAVRRGEIAARLRPRPLTLRGPELPRGTSAIRVWARTSSVSRRTVNLHLLLPGQGFASVPLGQLTRSWRLLEADLPSALDNARLIGIEFPAGTDVTSVIGQPGAISGNVTESDEAVDFGGLAAKARGRWRELGSFENWVGATAPDFEGVLVSSEFPRAPIAHGARFYLKGTSVPLVRPPLEIPAVENDAATYILPALAGPRPARLAVDGQLTVDLLGQRLQLLTIAESSLFPTITVEPEAFLVVDYDSLFASLNLDRPGAAPPSEAWFFDPRQAVALPRSAQVLRLEQERSLRRDDPLASGTRQLLTWSGYIAAALALLGLALSIRLALDVERQILAEYEALGVAPRVLRRSIQLRLVFLSVLGLVAALAGGALAACAVASLVAVTATAGRPLPPITSVNDWQSSAALLTAVAVAAVLAAGMLAGGSLREPTARRLRR